ncbi:MAG: DUF4357 domain-containing protein [Oscillospiraceae bacterium]|nr:DUF4357 domain-containing protein [Oscillospiraceae bacterium]
MSITKHIEQAIAELTMVGEKIKERFYVQPDSNDIAKLHRQYHNVKKLIGQLEEIKTELLPPDDNADLPLPRLPDEDYFINSRKDMGDKAYGVLEVDSRFKVLAGSYIALSVVDNMYDIVKRLRTEYSLFISDANILTKDLVFDNPGQAARFVTGKQVTGTEEWKTPDGVSLREYSAKEKIKSSEVVSSEYVFKKPKKISLFNKLHEVSSWRDVLIIVCDSVYERHPSIVLNLPNDNRMNSKRRATFAFERLGIKVKPVRLSCGIWVEANQSAATTMSICHKLLSICGYNKGTLEIEIQ